MTPNALSSGESSWSYLRKGNASHVATASSLAQSGTVAEQFCGPGETGENVYRAARPLCHDKWSRGKDGFLVTDIWGVEPGTWIPATPIVLLHQTGEKMYLCAHQHKSLTMIFLLPVSSILNGEQGVSTVKQQVVENVSSLPLLVK